MKFDWTLINHINKHENSFSDRTFRVRTHDGWIVKNIISDSNGIASTMVYVPDELHEWFTD